MDLLRCIVSFVRAAEGGSFSAAARSLGVTPAAVSKSVQKLEADLGVRLFARTTRQISLTEEGQLFLESCRDPAIQLEEAVGRLAERRGRPFGRVRLTATTAFGRRVLVPLLVEFSQNYPEIELDLTLDDHIADMVVERFDIGVRIAGQLADTTMIARHLAEIQLLVCASPEYIGRHGIPGTPWDLARHNCISIRMPSTGRLLKWEFAEGSQHYALEAAGTLAVNDPEALVEAALAGCGVVQLGSYLVLEHLRSNRLKPVLSSYLAPNWWIYLYYPSKQHLPMRVQVLLEFIARSFPDPSCYLSDFQTSAQ